MRYSLRGKLTDIKNNLWGRRRSRVQTYPVQDCLKGTMGRVIVIRPENSIFSQAVFFLRDDYFKGGAASRQELLRQAEDAAESFTRTVIPPGEGRGVSPWLIGTVIGLIAAGLLVVLYMKMI